MKCKQCLTEGRDAEMRSVSASTTLHAVSVFRDERGVDHAHDPNVTVIVHACSLGHTHRKLEARACWCGWSALPPARTKGRKLVSQGMK